VFPRLVKGRNAAKLRNLVVGLVKFFQLVLNLDADGEDTLKLEKENNVATRHSIARTRNANVHIKLANG